MVNSTFKQDGQINKRFYNKPVNEVIAKNRDFFKILSDISTIIVIGHSLNKVDSPYFKEVAKNAGRDGKPGFI